MNRTGFISTQENTYGYSVKGQKDKFVLRVWSTVEKDGELEKKKEIHASQHIFPPTRHQLSEALQLIVNSNESPKEEESDKK